MRCQYRRGGSTASAYRLSKSENDTSLPWRQQESSLQGLGAGGPEAEGPEFSSVTAIHFVLQMGAPLAALILRPCRAFSACLLLMLISVRVEAAPAVTLLLSDTGGIYQEAASALQADLESVGIPVSQQTPSQRGEFRREDWVVVFGVAALQQVMAERDTTPVLSILVPRASYLRITAGKARAVTALYLDQPLERMAALQHAALPNSRRTGVLLGATTKSLLADAKAAASSKRLDIRYRIVDSPSAVFPALTELAEDIDVLWLLPDPLIVNRNNLQSLFLQTYRHRLPIVAYSSALVQAGAMLGLYATPKQFGHEAAQWLKTMIPTGSRLPPPRYPASFVIAINPTVARSLNVSLPSLEVLTQRVNALDSQ